MSKCAVIQPIAQLDLLHVHVSVQAQISSVGKQLQSHFFYLKAQLYKFNDIRVIFLVFASLIIVG